MGVARQWKIRKWRLLEVTVRPRRPLFTLLSNVSMCTFCPHSREKQPLLSQTTSPDTSFRGSDTSYHNMHRGAPTGSGLNPISSCCASKAAVAGSGLTAIVETDVQPGLASAAAGQQDGVKSSSATVITVGPASLLKADFVVRGMTCASCVGALEYVLKGTPGVIGANVALMQESACVSWGRCV